MRTRVIILAAGRGTRMNAGTPKVLIPLEGRPMIMHLLDAIRASGIDPHPVIVTGYQAPLVERTLGPGYDYVRQDQQFGTGHAVACAEHLLAGHADAIIVLNGDHPFIKKNTIVELVRLHERESCVLSMMTALLNDFDGWRASFADFGRVIRDSSGKINAIVEIKDAIPEQCQIKEVNPNFFCFRASWLWPSIKKLNSNNVKGEYYLTYLVRVALAEGECIASMRVDPYEAIGLNTPEHLKLVESLRS